MMKRIIILITFITFIPIAKSQTFHGIIFSDSTDPKIGDAVFVDYHKMKIVFGTIAAALKMPYKEYDFYDQECTKNELINCLDNLSFGKDDIVFFYYTGHGARAVDENSKFPQMVFDPADEFTYPLFKVRDIIIQKSIAPRFTVVMGDLCNSVTNQLTVKIIESKGSTVMKSNSEKAYQTLFSERGNILIASSKPGETSATAFDELTRKPLGSAFTICFQNELDKIVASSSSPTWSSLLENSRQATINYKGHEPVFEINTNAGSSLPPSSPVVYNSSNSNELITALKKIASDNTNEAQRINLSQPTLNRYFASSNTKVEIISRSGATVLAKENAKDFLDRLSTSYKLIDFVELSANKDNNGKITYLKIHEIYRQ